MNQDCDICTFLQNPTHRIVVTDRWSVGVSNNQAYFGRAYAALREHKSSLSELDETDWQEFHQIVRRLEAAYKDVYGAEPLNWSCLMNNAYRVEAAQPHVHWHIYPRYKTAPVLNGVAYDDPLFGEFYDNTAERLVDDSTVEQIVAKLKTYLARN